MKRYVEELQDFITEQLEYGERIDYSTRISPVLMMNGIVYCSEFTRDCFTKKDFPSTHSEIIASLVEQEKLGDNIMTNQSFVLRLVTFYFDIIVNIISLCSHTH